MAGFRYSHWDGTQTYVPQSADALFDKLSEYLLHYGEEALSLLDQLEETDPDVIEALIDRGLIERDREGKYRVTPRGVKRVEVRALDELFGAQRRGVAGKHETPHKGAGQVVHEDSKPYEYGDPISQLNLHETLKNALVRQGGRTPLHVTEDDFVVHDTEFQAHCATVLLLDMSGSMDRYGKFGQAKRVALALQQLVRSRYTGDTLEIVGFYSLAAPLTERELFYAAPKPVSMFDSHVHLRISLDTPPRRMPQHFTNIHLGLQYARRSLRKHSAQNKQIIVVTDGEPTAHVEGRDVLLIYPPAEKTARYTLAEAKRCAEEGIFVSSFALIEDYFYLGLVNFVEQMASVTGGVAAYCKADDLGNLVLESFTKGRRRRRRM